MGKDKRGITDESLIEAAQGGDQLAFGQLVDRYKDVVFATVVAITRDFDSAHDIAQEAFLRAWFGLGKLKTGSSLPGWLRTIARNRALTWLERQRRRPQEENIDLTQIADSADSPEQNAEKAERRRLVETALKHPARVNKDQLRTLENLHDNFARLLSSTFSGAMRPVVDVDTAFVDQTTYAEFIMSLSNPSCSCQFTLGPTSGQAILDFAMPVTFAFVDRIFGGKGSSQGVDARQLSPIEIMSRSLKDMNLQRLGMAMVMLKLKENLLKVSSAGIPGLLIYRHADATIEEVEIPGMPLGYITHFDYEEREVQLHSGDVVLMMSDGLIEQRDAAGEMLGFERTRVFFRQVADQPPDTICRHMAQKGE